MAERAEPFVLADGRTCVCGCKSCAGAYHHCLRHGNGCHLFGHCGWQPGMLLCPEVDPDRRGAGRGTLERFAGSVAP